ncbi:hypothetical protein QJS04_geneDACA002779 [Acorus gramineus]|uniref:Uncharacterized protein n=1 Tax=Acorus gramineus TaxID=55184 RepID=A0AAV9BRG2_ACOGR|nr:hypothetical protein QJS04_geneDACA002779 [Acorus gramineus]
MFHVHCLLPHYNYFIQPPPVVDNVSPYSSIENIAVQKLTPEYKIGMERLVKSKAPPMNPIRCFTHICNCITHDAPIEEKKNKNYMSKRRERTTSLFKKI